MKNLSIKDLEINRQLDAVGLRKLIGGGKFSPVFVLLRRGPIFEKLEKVLKKKRKSKLTIIVKCPQ